MNAAWAAKFPRSSLRAALRLRLIAGLEICDAEESYWLRGGAAFEEIDPQLRCIPEVIRYAIGEDGSCTRIGQRIPETPLPAGPWRAFMAMATLQPQPAALPAKVAATVAILLVRSERIAEPGAMVITRRQWAEYAAHAPQIRLSPLKFAGCADGRTVVLGSPLPPIRGNFFSEIDGLLIPAGYRWMPAVEGKILRRVMRLADGDRALFAEDGSYERIAAECIAAASRSAARQSCQPDDSRRAQ